MVQIYSTNSVIFNAVYTALSEYDVFIQSIIDTRNLILLCKVSILCALLCLLSYARRFFGKNEKIITKCLVYACFIGFTFSCFKTVHHYSQKKKDFVVSYKSKIHTAFGFSKSDYMVDIVEYQTAQKQGFEKYAVEKSLEITKEISRHNHNIINPKKARLI